MHDWKQSFCIKYVPLNFSPLCLRMISNKTHAHTHTKTVKFPKFRELWKGPSVAFHSACMSESRHAERLHVSGDDVSLCLRAPPTQPYHTVPSLKNQNGHFMPTVATKQQIKNQNNSPSSLWRRIGAVSLTMATLRPSSHTKTFFYYRDVVL